MLIRKIAPLTAAFALIAISAVAQPTVAIAPPSSSEFGRADGGALEMVTKSRERLSGTLSLSRDFGAFGGNRYDGSVGGAVVNDRVWFFASASLLPAMRFSPAASGAVDTRVTAQPVDWMSVSGWYARAQQAALTVTPSSPMNVTSVPSSWLSLHATAMPNDHTLMEFSFSRRNAATPVFGTVTP